MRIHALAIGALLLAACSDHPNPAEPNVRRAFASAGDHQVGMVEGTLPIPLEITVLARPGVPLEGATVEWVAITNGHVIPERWKTDANGRARAQFVVGGVAGTASTIAVVDGRDSIPFVLEVRDPNPRESPIPLGGFLPLGFTTYEGSGETVHPDYAAVPWTIGNRLAITPYPNGNSNFEQPSIFASSAMFPWSVPDGAANPTVAPPPLGTGYYSDPDIVWVPEHQELWMYYRQTFRENTIHVVRSRDGINWSPPMQVLAAPNHAIVSPSVVHRRPGEWLMWSINGGPGGCNAIDTRLELRQSTDGLSWSAPTRLPLHHDGLSPWHLDVQWIESRAEYWAVYNAKGAGGCATAALFLARSADGVVWTPILEPLVTKGADPAFKDIVYRASFRYQPGTGELLLWVSGATFDLVRSRYVWSTALTRRRIDAILAAGPRSRANPANALSPAPAELIDWP